MKPILRNILGISNLKKDTIVVTGASGWLGKSAVAVLTNEFSNYRVIALSRKIQLNKSNSDLIYMSYDEFLRNDYEITGLVHTAFMTKNYIEEIGPIKYVDQNTKINNWLLNFIKSKNPKWTVAISSGATKQYIDKVEAGLPIFDSDLYGKMKLEEEEALLGSDIPNVAIGRLWAASGRYMQNHKIYALGQFIEAAINGKNIKIASSEPVYRRYIDAEDFMKVLVMTALNSSRTLFDSGGVLTTIENLAQEVAKFFKNKNNSKIEIEYGEKKISIENANYFAKSEKFLELQSKFKIQERSIPEQIDRTSVAVTAKLGTR
jgi:nucleoside-diphosphate-sugar epimerase